MSTVSRRTILLGAAGIAVFPAMPKTALPDTINLPDGWRPEGIAIGDRPYAYFGSLADGSIYRASLITGEGQVISTGPGTPSVGLKIDDQGLLFVAGGSAGNVRIVSAATGDVLAVHQLASGTTFVNDVVLTRRSAWFTDSAATTPVLYQISRSPYVDGFVTLPLTGDLQFVEGGPNANGIVRTPDGTGLIVVQSVTGTLFRVDPATGVTSAIDLGGESVPNGDGLLLRGRTLYVVQNRLNTLAVLELNRAATEGRVVQRVTDPRFDVPTTVAAFRNRLYLPNARFTTTPTPTTTYTAVAIPVP